mmetsp:Transcript_11809/g.18775  ORF Transcript_11809/g.18775 Transcript_11809/m.18775 type:complete len:89 (+) Transcript_11809:108-374(+)
MLLLLRVRMTNGGSAMMSTVCALMRTMSRLAGPQRCVGMKARAHQACHKQLTSLFTIAAKSDDRLENVFSKIAWRIKNTRECVLESIW